MRNLAFLLITTALLTGCFNSESQFEACLAQETKEFQRIVHPNKWSIENFDQDMFSKRYDVEVDKEELEILLSSIEGLTKVTHEEWRAMDAIENQILINHGWEIGNWWGNPPTEFVITDEISLLIKVAHNKASTKHTSFIVDKFYSATVKQMFWGIMDEISKEEARLMLNSEIPYDSVIYFDTVLNHFEKYLYPAPKTPEILARELCNSRGLYK